MRSIFSGLMSWVLDTKNWGKIGVFSLICIIAILIFRMSMDNNRAEKARINAQNRIAELSLVVKENERTFSRLAQERNDALSELNNRVPELAEIIRQRDEQILSLTHAIANVRPINVVIRDEGANESEQQNPDGSSRSRVDFDTIHEDFIRIHGFTLTNPAEANLSMEFVRPINFTVATTQLPDRSWRTYLHSDWPNLEIGQIESQITPLEQVETSRRSWVADFEIGLWGAAGVSGDVGVLGLEAGYDFGWLELGVLAGGARYPTSVDFVIGGRVAISPGEW